VPAATATIPVGQSLLVSFHLTSSDPDDFGTPAGPDRAGGGDAGGVDPPQLSAEASAAKSAMGRDVGRMPASI
jgi:hypothetical protein